MGRLDPNFTAYDLADADIWDRVGALAPSSKPVRGRLFSGAHKQDKQRRVPPMAAQDIQATPETINVKTAGADQSLAAPKTRGRTERPILFSEVMEPLPAYAPDPALDAGWAAAAILDDSLHRKHTSSLGLPHAPVPALDQTDTAKRAWGRLRPAVIEAADPRQTSQMSVARMAETEVSQSFDQLRMRLLQTLKENGWRRVAITSPTPGCGSTFVACNLTVSLSRIREQRTVLMDLNLRAPGVAKAFALRTETNISGYLAGEVSASQSIQRYQDNVALAAGRSCATATAEMLYDTRTITALHQLEQDLQPDVMLFDLPPMLAYDDVTAFLPQVDGVLLVSNGTKTMGKEIEACERAIAGRTKLLGVVMNQARKSDCKAMGYRNA